MNILIKIIFYPLLCSTVLFAQAAQNPFGAEYTSPAAQDSTASDSTDFSDQFAADMDSMAIEPPDSSGIIPQVDFPRIMGQKSDTTLYRGLDYGSFKDVFAWLPGAYLADRGMVGDDSKGALYAGVPGEFDLYYDFLHLSDPLTGHADLSLIPVEGIGSMDMITGHSDGRYGYAVPGQTLAISPLNIATFPPRSGVTYRTGQSEYDDIDVRVGLFTSKKMSINAGGLLKNYLGRVDRNNYEARKLNLQILRKLVSNWSLQYLYLQNHSELDVPVLQSRDVYKLYDPHQTKSRVDQGLGLYYGNTLSITTQYTKNRRDYYDFFGQVRSQYQSQENSDYRVTAQAQQRFAGLYWNAGGEYIKQQLESRQWGNNNALQYQGWLTTSLNLESLTATAGLRQMVLADFDKSYTLPEVNVTWQPDSLFRVFAWANQFVKTPSFEALYSSGPFVMGNPDLKTSSYDQAGGGVEWNWHGLQTYLCLSGMNIENQIAVYAAADQDTGQFINQIAHTRYAVDWAVNYNWQYGLSAFVKGKYSYITSKDEYFDITNFPSVSGQGYIQYHGLLFDGDLDLTVRLGGALTGESFTPERYFAQYPLSEWIADPIFVPFLLIKPRVKSMTMFLSFQNLTNTNYHKVFAYPMPLYEFRWGFTWQFFD